MRGGYVCDERDFNFSLNISGNTSCSGRGNSEPDIGRELFSKALGRPRASQHRQHQRVIPRRCPEPHPLDPRPIHPALRLPDQDWPSKLKAWLLLLHWQQEGGLSRLVQT